MKEAETIAAATPVCGVNFSTFLIRCLLLIILIRRVRDRLPFRLPAFGKYPCETAFLTIKAGSGTETTI